MGKEPGGANEPGMEEKLEKEEVRKSRLEVPGDPEGWSRGRQRECEPREAGESAKANRATYWKGQMTLGCWGRGNLTWTGPGKFQQRFRKRTSRRHDLLRARFYSVSVFPD